MDQITDHSNIKRTVGPSVARPMRRAASVVAAAVLVVAAAYFGLAHYRGGGQVAQPQAAPPPVTVSRPLQRDIDTRLGFLGQFSAINRVELRAQVGGILTEIHFEDGQIVHKGDLLFTIDPRPYEIKLAQATAHYKPRRHTLRSRTISSRAPNRFGAVISRPRRRSTSAPPTRTLQQPLSRMPKRGFGMPNLTSNIAASRRLSPGGSGLARSRSGAW